MSADDVYFWANWILVAALLIGVAATYAIVVSGNIRDIALKRDLSAASERAAILEREAAEAKLEQEKLKAQVLWRNLSITEENILITGLVMGHGSVTIAYVQNDPEAVYFAVLISRVFEAANKAKLDDNKWKVRGDPRLYSDGNIFDLSIFGKSGAALASTKKAFISAKLPFLEEEVPPPVTRIGVMTTSGMAPTTDVVIMVGSKRPPF